MEGEDNVMAPQTLTGLVKVHVCAFVLMVFPDVLLVLLL